MIIQMRWLPLILCFITTNTLYATENPIITDWEYEGLNRPTKSISDFKIALDGTILANKTCRFTQEGFYSVCETKSTDPKLNEMTMSYEKFIDNQRQIRITIYPKDAPYGRFYVTERHEGNKVYTDHPSYFTEITYSNSNRIIQLKSGALDTSEFDETIYYYYLAANEEKSQAAIDALKDGEKALFFTQLEKDEFGNKTKIAIEPTDDEPYTAQRIIFYYP